MYIHTLARAGKRDEISMYGSWLAVTDVCVWKGGALMLQMDGGTGCAAIRLTWNNEHETA